MIKMKEVFTLSQLRHAYSQLIGGPSSTKLSSIDLKKKLTEKFPTKLKFMKPSYMAYSKSSEYVLSADEDFVSDYIHSAVLGSGISISVNIKNVAVSISEDAQREHEGKAVNRNLFNLVG